MCWVMPPASCSATRVERMRVEQRGLAVVDVAHDGHHRRPGRQSGRWSPRALLPLVLRHLLGRRDHRVDPEVGADLLGELVRQRLVGGDHDPLLDEQGEQVLGGDVELLGQLAGGHHLGQDDRPLGRLTVAELDRPRTGRRHRHAGRPRRCCCRRRAFLLGRPGGRRAGAPVGRVAAPSCWLRSFCSSNLLRRSRISRASAADLALRPLPAGVSGLAAASAAASFCFFSSSPLGEQALLDLVRRQLAQALLERRPGPPRAHALAAPRPARRGRW